MRGQLKRCEVCGAGMHRFGFPADGLRGFGTSHKPTAVACANGLIFDVERALAATDPDARAHILEQISQKATMLGFAIDRCLGATP